jgi:hypothetical protein
MSGKGKDVLVAIGIIGAVSLFIASGIITTCQPKEPSRSDILSERIMLHTGEVTMIHRGGCSDYKKNRESEAVSIEEYIKRKDHYYCTCVNDSLMDAISEANYHKQMALDDWYSEFYCGEYRGEIGKRMRFMYNGTKGRELQYVYAEDGFKVATNKDKRLLSEIETERFFNKVPKLKKLLNN